ncbi:MAG: zinc ribbon domain-containing protein [Actinobacteria bacterium]|nr:zinc ribbon domain-containing protein [Actinomycetota bacterium]MBU1943551.1 zinc ribbon domain-containing protein [Actinomycetota bacterium]MBU2687560.1 zinc ribbon domain-containing protein [Actinomycetota bacterium]
MACHVARALLVVLLFCISVTLVAGCGTSDTAEEKAYKAQIESVRTRWNAIQTEAEAYSQQYTQQLETTTSLQSAASLVHGFQQKLQGSIGQFRQLESDLAQIQPPARFAGNHSMMINGIEALVTALNQMSQTVGSALQPGADLNALEAQIKAEAESAEEGEDAFVQGATGVLPVNWPVVVGFFVVVLAVGSCFGYISGRMGQKDGRSFGGYFCLGFFLGLIGVLIAYLITRGGRQPVRDYRQPIQEGYAYVPPPAPWQAQPTQQYQPDLYAPRDFAPAYVDHTGERPRTRPTGVAGPVPVASDSSLIRCPNCSASWTPDYIFCGDCGAPIQQL